MLSYNLALTDSSIRDLADSAALRRRLAQAFAGEGAVSERIVVGLLSGSRGVLAVNAVDRSRCAGDLGDLGERGLCAAWPAAPRIRPGCITKLFTAALAVEACRAGRAALDTPITALLGGIAADAPKSITLRHLLEHTHGLDDSLVREVPRLASGEIDARRLIEALSAKPLAPPGDLYSYSSAGAWLIAAWLERSSGAPFTALLRERLGFIPPGLASGHAKPGAICPATGGVLEVPVAALLRFLSTAFEANGDLTGSARALVPMPGWSVLERGVRLGWKIHDGGWLGHGSVWPGASVLVRVHPVERIALVIASSGRPATVIAAKLLGRRLPELARLRMPRPLAPKRVSPVELAAIEGCYAVAGRRATISRRNGRLELTLWQRDQADRPFAAAARAALRPYEDGVLFTSPPCDGFPYVQRVEAPGGNRDYIWNGQSLLPRL